MEKIGSRLKVLAILLALLFAALTTRLWFLQVLATEANQEASRDVSRRAIEIPAPRGRILDSSGEELVRNAPIRLLRINKEVLAESGRTDEVLETLAPLLEMSVEQVRAKLDDTKYLDNQPKPIAELPSKEAGLAIETHLDDFPGVSLADTEAREYPEGRLAANLLGWPAQITAEDFGTPAFEGYGPNDIVGISGVERSYESWLRGTKGLERFLVNREGERTQNLPKREPVAGDDVYLTVDTDVQRYATEELERGILAARTRLNEDGKNFRATAGTVLVMDMHGGIVAEVSYPSFDPDWFVGGLTQCQSIFLFGGKATGDCSKVESYQPTLNRAVSLTYMPGSTFKPFVSLVASKEGVVNLDGGTYPCDNDYVAQTERDSEDPTKFGNASPADGSYMSIAQALVSSCDTVFYSFGDTFWLRSRQTDFQEEPFQQGLHDWGFGELTGVDLPGEARGIVPDAAWAEDQEVLKPYGWNVPGPDILLATGSGHVQITPLQLASAYVALANGGKRCTPHVVDRVVEAGGGATVKKNKGNCHPVPFAKKDLDYVRTALAGVTHPGGTAGGSFLGFPFDQVTVAGKTGTAVRDGGFQSTSWFASMVPAEDPQYVVLAMVEEGGYGSETAAPIVRHIIERMNGITATYVGAQAGTD